MHKAVSTGVKNYSAKRAKRRIANIVNTAKTTCAGRLACQLSIATRAKHMFVWVASNNSMHMHGYCECMRRQWEIGNSVRLCVVFRA